MKLYTMDIYKVDDMLFETKDAAVAWYTQEGWKDHSYPWCELKSVAVTDSGDIEIVWTDPDNNAVSSITLDAEIVQMTTSL